MKPILFISFFLTGCVPLLEFADDVLDHEIQIETENVRGYSLPNFKITHITPFGVRIP